jgi:osmotically-inducible protein OsmY
MSATTITVRIVRRPMTSSNQERTMSKSDTQLKHDIETELLWDPRVNAAKIGVVVYKGTVSLLGAVDTYAQKWAAQDAAKRVFGVRTVVQDLTVRILKEHKRSDSEIAVAVQHALQWDVFTPKSVSARIDDGAVTLEGSVTWNFERDAAEQAVRNLTGVVAVYNVISLKTHASTTDVKAKVEAALQRQATEDGKPITIDTSGGKVTLTGHASSWQSIEDAANAAWAAPGVTEVVDRVTLQMTY